jgi:epoxyqueuosine reductase
MVSIEGLEKSIKAEANRLGFSLSGITSADPLQEFPRFETWLANGHHAGMKYLESTYHRESRKDPRSLFPGVKSILCLAYPYSLTFVTQESEPRTAIIAGYADGEDYHLEIPKKLSSLVKHIESLVDQPIEYTIYTDSAPILERELARRAGLGWIGKNSCLISPEFGSAFLLAEVFLDISLIPDGPFTPDRCGTCRKCIDNCPTHAINLNRTINSNRCISYYTIENKELIPEEIAQKMGGWLFGCDICQAVCPWNKQFIKTEDLGFSHQELLGFLQLTQDTFSARFHRSPISRAKYFGFMRNTLTIIGNQGNFDDIPVLEQFLKTNSIHDLTDHAHSVIAQLKNKPPH